MKKLSNLGAVLCFVFIVAAARGQGSAPAALPSQSRATAANQAPIEKKKEATNIAPATEAITTEIYADEATFDSGKYIGVFTGHVVVIDSRFNVQGDKLTAYLNKKENDGLEKAIVEGNVAVVRDRPDPNGGPPTRSVSRSDKAVYTVKDGSFLLTGMPRVQQGLNTNVATSPDTVMVLDETGQLHTHGPSRTEIRQPPTTPTPKP